MIDFHKLNLNIICNYLASIHFVKQEKICIRFIFFISKAENNHFEVINKCIINFRGFLEKFKYFFKCTSL